ncbi:hypothetical protein PIB30_047225 [Stylosanthes scabra]|uniref:Terpene synthase metal-binding domain-containing protein n=1 Tax=Stylosanthes scabra TaxID=79078 RepID=A0ABU6WGK8_9FABA|nr:hypothetical protein [Stylosanthes scabra]
MAMKNYNIRRVAEYKVLESDQYKFRFCSREVQSFAQLNSTKLPLQAVIQKFVAYQATCYCKTRFGLGYLLIKLPIQLHPTCRHWALWDPKIIETLPEYMQLCFLSLYNLVNDLAFEFLKIKGFYIAPYLKKSWADICKSYYREAKWSHDGYKAGYEEYMENAWITIGVPAMLVHTYFLIPHSFKKEELLCIQQYCDIIRLPSIITRLANDLGSYQRESEKGDTLKLIQCYTNETGASEDNTRAHIKSILSSTWKKLNKEACNSSLPQIFIDMAMNIARMTMCVYNHEDGHTMQDSHMKTRVLSLIVHPISYKENLGAKESKNGDSLIS